MNNESSFEWVEFPNNFKYRMRPGTEGNRCYGGGNCLAPPEYLVKDGDCATAGIQQSIAEAERIVEKSLAFELA
jgi:hypothetical protein